MRFPYGIRDVGLLKSAVGSPQFTFDEDLYPDLFIKVAALVHSLLPNHIFVDSNKRTAMLNMMTFIELNGYVFTACKKRLLLLLYLLKMINLSLKK